MSNGINRMPTHKIVALAILVSIVAGLGILALSGGIKISAAFLSGVMIGMVLPLGLAAVFGVPKLERSSKSGNTPPV